MSEDFTASKLEYLLSDMVNVNHNIMFIPLFPTEIVDDLWGQMINYVNDEQKNSLDHFLIEQLLLIAFATDDSLPGKIRRGELNFSNKFLTQKGVLTLTEELYWIPNGLISEIIIALDIYHVIIRDGNLIDLFFSLDFNLSLIKLKAISIINIKVFDYDLSDTLFNNSTIEEIYLIDVPDNLLPVDLTKMQGLKKLSVINSPLSHLPKLNSVSNKNLEVLILDKTDIQEIDFLNCPHHNLKELRFTFGSVKELKNLNSLINLKYLDVSRQNITQLEIDGLANLEVLIARRNKLTTFPELKKSAHSLKVLDLSFNSIQLSDDIIKFTQLEDFIFESNYFSTIGECFTPFNQVYRLDLAGNDISKIDSVFLNYKRLSSLNLENNNLESFVDIVNSIPNDNVEIRLRGNNLSNDEKLKLINLENKTIVL